ncbi:MAG: 16S rRNA (cytosine(1402)-N(4))-methyltransferase RsmH [Ignavibacteriae bacterium]|nr:16S rRNA (cytosine(1402)-N(4))-methyltransferase RsmH [Ignavibacteriota bacterium]
MIEGYHKPVLVDEVVRLLCAGLDGVYVDCTLGGGGHAANILQHVTPQSTLIGIDRDTDALDEARKNLIEFTGRVLFVQDNFANVRIRVEELIDGNIVGMLLDLGVSSHQIDAAHRGFSFQSESRLDMRMSRNQQLDAWTVVNTYDEPQISNVFWKYGEERFSRKIARRITERRRNKTLDTTRELAEVVESVVGQRMLTKSLARIFQALRIEVNNELENLQQGLCDAVEMLHPGGRLVVISYHSLEDRIVKTFFREQSQPETTGAESLLRRIDMNAKIRVLTKKPIVPTETEINRNPRARSAKLRAVERL